MTNLIPIEKIIERLRYENPWWVTKEIPNTYSSMSKRLYFDLFFPFVIERNINRAVVLMGPRRVGKTVMLFHCIENLLNCNLAFAKTASTEGSIAIIVSTNIAYSLLFVQFCPSNNSIKFFTITFFASTSCGNSFMKLLMSGKIDSQSVITLLITSDKKVSVSASIPPLLTYSESLKYSATKRFLYSALTASSCSCTQRL